MNLKIFLFSFVLLAVTLVSAKTPLVILHTNDTHSQIEPLGSREGKYAGNGGILRREALIRKIRATSSQVLVFESGDFVQGSAYFSQFKGEADIKLMNFLKLDAVTLGNHEFDNGLNALAAMLSKANFPVVCTNYNLSGTVLKNIVKPWLILTKGKLRIGVVGANLDLNGKVSEANRRGVIYLNPISTLDATAGWLKKTKQCDLVICLSHLGYKNDNGKVDDLELAKRTRNIDVILGGHTHTFMEKPIIIRNLDNREVIINQVGKWGLCLGRLNLEIETHSN